MKKSVCQYNYAVEKKSFGNTRLRKYKIGLVIVMKHNGKSSQWVCYCNQAEKRL